MGAQGRVSPGPIQRERRLAATLLLGVVLLFVACGGSETPSALATPPATTTAPTGGVSHNMTLLSHLDGAALSGAAPVQGSGCWGYTSPDGRRFALVGTSGGLSIVEVTEPTNARRVAFIPGATSTWREVQTYRQYIYVTTEARTGLDIVDMSNPDQPTKVQTWNKTFTSAHTLWIDVPRGLLFANGTSQGMRVLDLEPDPRDPVEVGAFTEFYIHDSHTRGETLYASAINDGFLAILDVRRPEAIREVTRFFTGGRFTHNSWLTDDERYLFTTDERRGRPLEGWDIGNPLAPRKVSEYIARSGTLPHNVMIDGTRMVVAHYDEGVHLVDVRDPERPQNLGFYDTYPGVFTGTFGAWGAYIFPGSNLIVVSDITGGLFVVGYTGP
jgi:choice-of-anchor B domain-containing protein